MSLRDLQSLEFLLPSNTELAVGKRKRRPVVAGLQQFGGTPAAGDKGGEFRRNLQELPAVLVFA